MPYQEQRALFRQRTSTLAEATNKNPVLLEGEKWWEVDEANLTTGRSKTGKDGRVVNDVIVGTAFNDLPFDPTGTGEGGPGDPTNLSITNRTATGLTIASSTGGDAEVPVATETLAGLESAADKAKLDSIIVDSARIIRIPVRNNSGVNIPKGSPCYQTSSSGTAITVALADASQEETASQTLGLAEAEMPHNSNGFLIERGLLDGLNTSTLTQGEIVWLSETAGALTTTRPTQPAHGVICGYCIKQGAGTSGILYVKVSNGQELYELHDVLISGEPDGQAQVLRRFADGLWKNSVLLPGDVGAATAAQGALAATSVQSVQIVPPSGWSTSSTNTGGSVTLTLGLPSGFSLPSTSSQTNWDSAYSMRGQWSGGATGLNAATGRASLELGSAALASAGDFATPSALTTGLAGKADLVGGVIPSGQIPAIAISDYLGAVASQAAMLALTGQRGDWCLRTDGSSAGMWVLSADNAALLANWVQIPVPIVPVQSVNGQTGVITLGPGDVGAATAAQGALAATAVQPAELASTLFSYLTIANGALTYQPLDGDLTAIAGLSTTTYGRSFLTLVNAAAGRTWLELGTAAVAATSDFLPTTYVIVNIAYAATIDIDFAAYTGKLLVIGTLTGNLTFTFSNVVQGRFVSVDLLCDSASRTLTFPGLAVFLTTKPSSIAANKAAAITFTVTRTPANTTDSSAVRVNYGVQT